MTKTEKHTNKVEQKTISQIVHNNKSSDQIESKMKASSQDNSRKELQKRATRNRALLRLWGVI